MVESMTSKVLLGMSVLGSAISPATSEESFKTKITLLTNIMVGNYDDELLCAHFSYQEKKQPETIEQARSHVLAKASLDRLKNLIRSDIQKIVEAGLEEDRKNLLLKLKETNAPHRLGTVAEIAAKLGVSKSEVRRMKASGALDALEALDGV